jgi:hypothetical protein
MAETLASRTRAELLRKIERHIAEHALSESAFGLRSCNDVKIVGRIRSGANVTLGTIERIETWMAMQPQPVTSAAA